MNKDRSYFAFLEVLENPGCPICHRVLEDSRHYLDSLLYERVLDVPTRLGLMDSFGFCSWHTWQIPALPAICSPAVGFSIFASDVLRKFDLLAQAKATNGYKKRQWRLWKAPFKRYSDKLFWRLKGKPCPACLHVARAESDYLRELLDFFEDQQFLSAYESSDGICLRHFFRLEQRSRDHVKFSLVARVQLKKVQSLRSIIDEFIRKQDHRFRDEMTPAEAKAWRVAMEFLAGKPGVFSNEMEHEPIVDSHKKESSKQEVSQRFQPYSTLTQVQLQTKMRSAQQVTFYLKQPLPAEITSSLRDLIATEPHPDVAVVVEDVADVSYLRLLYTHGFKLFYGVGLPPQKLMFLGAKDGFVIDEGALVRSISTRAIRDPESVYYRLLWCRFGHAILLNGVVKETDVEKWLICLVANGGREIWCRLKQTPGAELPPAGSKIQVFCWEKWLTQVLEVIELQITDELG